MGSIRSKPINVPHSITADSLIASHQRLLTSPVSTTHIVITICMLRLEFDEQRRSEMQQRWPTTVDVAGTCPTANCLGSSCCCDQQLRSPLGQQHLPVNSNLATAARPPLIRMKDIAGDVSSGDEADDNDVNGNGGSAVNRPKQLIEHAEPTNRNDAKLNETTALVDKLCPISVNAANYKKNKQRPLSAVDDNIEVIHVNSSDSVTNGDCRRNNNANDSGESASTAIGRISDISNNNDNESAAYADACLTPAHSATACASLCGHRSASHKAHTSACQHRCSSCSSSSSAQAGTSQSPTTPVKIKKNTWKLNCAKLIPGNKSSSTSASSIAAATAAVAASPVAIDASTSCVCTSYRKMDEHDMLDDTAAPTLSSAAIRGDCMPNATAIGSANIRLEQQTDADGGIDAASFARLGIGSPDSSSNAATPRTTNASSANPDPSLNYADASSASKRLDRPSGAGPPGHSERSDQRPQPAEPPPVVNVAAPAQQQLGSAAFASMADELRARVIIHSQIDFVHCLVPDLQRIAASVFYWGKMDRYEAERLLDGKPEGTFLLRDSAQEEFLFSVSFRKYGRSLHARIEQFNHKFSFDCHDPGVFTSDSVTRLLEHYKDPASVMFFEPALTLPLTRNYCFTLQELSRAAIVSRTTYDGITQLMLPVTLKAYLREYHYRQRVHEHRFDESAYNAANGAQHQLHKHLPQ